MGKSPLLTNNNAAPIIIPQKLDDVTLKPLDDIFVPLETIRPGKWPAETLVNLVNFKVMMTNIYRVNSIL